MTPTRRVDGQSDVLSGVWFDLPVGLRRTPGLSSGEGTNRRRTPGRNGVVPGDGTERETEYGGRQGRGRKGTRGVLVRVRTTGHQEPMSRRTRMTEKGVLKILDLRLRPVPGGKTVKRLPEEPTGVRGEKTLLGPFPRTLLCLPFHRVWVSCYTRPGPPVSIKQGTSLTRDLMTPPRPISLCPDRLGLPSSPGEDLLGLLSSSTSSRRGEVPRRRNRVTTENINRGST